MHKTMIVAALAAGVMFGYSGRAWTQTDQKLPLAGYAAAKDIPGARELPNPQVDYKVVFPVATGPQPEAIGTSPRCSIRAAATRCWPMMSTRRGTTGRSTRTSRCSTS